MSSGIPRNPTDPGLCGDCRHGRCQLSAKGSEFWRCGREETDERWMRYPPLPVMRCDGFEPTTDEG